MGNDRLIEKLNLGGHLMAVTRVGRGDIIMIGTSHMFGRRGTVDLGWPLLWCRTGTVKWSDPLLYFWQRRGYWLTLYQSLSALNVRGDSRVRFWFSFSLININSLLNIGRLFIDLFLINLSHIIWRKFFFLLKFLVHSCYELSILIRLLRVLVRVSSIRCFPHRRVIAFLHIIVCSRFMKSLFTGGGL